jgi:hypothetical protein
MSELTDLLASQTASKNKLLNQLDWHNGVDKTYFVGESKSDTSPAEWNGAGRKAFLIWHNAQGVNENDIDQMFVDMYAEMQSTDNSSPSADFEYNSDIVSTMQASIDSYTADMASIQARIDAGDTTIADS